MNVYKHTVVSFTVSAFILIAFRNLQVSISCFLTGVLIDLDHIVDCYMNHILSDIFGYLRHPKRLASFLSSGYLKYEPLCKVYKPLHSMELLVFVPFLYAFGAWNGIATGALLGFIAHLIMDNMALGHIGGISLIYKIKKGFPRGSEIVKQRLSKIGKDVGKCQICGVQGNMIIHKRHGWYMGFTKKGLSKTVILCRECHGRIHNAKG